MNPRTCDSRQKPAILLAISSMRIGGAESYVASLARSLNNRGFRVVVASRGGKLARMLAVEPGIKHYFVHMRFDKRLASYWLQAIARREHIDVIHANMTTAGKCVSRMCGRTGVPWVMTAHSRFGNSQDDVRLYQADRVVCVSHFLKDWVVANTGAPENRLEVIYNGVDMATFTRDGRGVAVRESLGVPRDKFLIGIVARTLTENRKGHSDLMHALSEYPAARDWHLAVVGDGKAGPRLRRLSHELGVQDRVHFMGNWVDVAPAIEALDVVTLPTYAETFGLAMAEGMAMEKPVVAYAVDATPEVVDDGRTGFLVPRGDVGALVDRLRILDQDRKLGEEFGKRGRERVSSRFNEEDMVDRVTDLYARVLEEHTHAA